MLHRDPFTVWLDAQPLGTAPVPALYNPAAFLGASPTGWQITVGRTRFVYRVPPETPDILYIVLIERAEGRHALQSPFRDMVRLLRLIKEARVGVSWIRGHVEPVKHRPQDALGRERILAFYRRYLTAVSTGFNHGIEWFGGNLDAFSWETEKKKVRSHLSLPGMAD